MMQLPTRETPLLDAAAMYLDLGLRPIPVYGVRDSGSCMCGDPACKAIGKHPIGKQWQKNAPRTFEEARDLFDGHAGNMGACVADTPFVVLDFDGESGLGILNEMEEADLVPRTLRARSGSGGAHLFFELGSRHDANEISDRRVHSGGWDVKKRGQVLVAPSRHASGGYYEWIDAVPIARLTDELYSRIRKTISVVPTASDTGGSRQNMYVRAAAYVAKMAAAISGQGGHDATFAVARKLAKDFELSDSEAWSLLCEYNERCIPPWSEKDLRHKLNDAKNARVANPVADRAPRLYAVGNAAVAAAVPPDSSPNEDWRAELLWQESRTGKRKLVTHAANVIRILTLHEAWRGRLSFDEFRGRVVCDGPPWDRYARATETDPIWSDEDATRLHAWLRHEFHQYAFSPNVTDCERSVDVVARANGFHPVRRYLESTVWDQASRLSRMGVDYFGAENTDYVANVFRWWMISAVARIFKPGCKADHVLILEGSQGTGKSSALGILGGDWFNDTPIDLNSKDAYGQIKGKWIVELAELDSLFRVEASRAKAFFTSPVDNYRPAYGRREKEQPRQCVFAGSVNEGTYLRDPTGARRFWPVRCGAIDRAALRRDRDQLWAEAVTLFREGARWWPAEAEETKATEEAQDDRAERDDWEDKIRPYIVSSAKTEVTSAEVLEHALKLDAKDWTRASQIRVGNILIHRLHWTKHRPRTSGAVRCWVYRGPNYKETDRTGENA